MREPMIGPAKLAYPPMTDMMSTSKDMDMSRKWGETIFFSRMKRAPDKPAISPEKAKTMSFAAFTLTPRKPVLFEFDLIPVSVFPRGVFVKYQETKTARTAKRSVK